MMLYLAHAQRASGGYIPPTNCEDKNKPSHWFNNKQTQELVELLISRVFGSVQRLNWPWRSMSLMFIVACTLAWFRADKGLYALIERAMAYCWLRYWDKKRYNQTAIPFSFTFPIKWERVSCLRFKRKCLFYIQLKKLAIV